MISVSFWTKPRLLYVGLLGLVCIMNILFSTWWKSPPVKMHIESSAINSNAIPIMDQVVADQRALLTLFTTFKPDKNRSAIYETTIRNWALLQPEVVPVLYVQSMDDTLRSYAEENGWQIRLIPKSNAFNTPFVNHLYVDAEENFASEFYCYANGDILFDYNFVQTLEAVLAEMPDKNVLVIGRRKNYALKDPRNISLTTIDEFDSAKPHIADSVHWALTSAIDYFATRSGMFHWERMADVVVGRGGYDSYVVYFARHRANATIIDASGTVRAYHIQAPGKRMSHHSDKDRDKKYNFRAIRDGEHVKLGKVWNIGTVKAGSILSKFVGDKMEIKFVPRHAPKKRSPPNLATSATESQLSINRTL